MIASLTDPKNPTIAKVDLYPIAITSELLLKLGENVVWILNQPGSVLLKAEISISGQTPQVVWTTLTLK